MSSLEEQAEIKHLQIMSKIPNVNTLNAKKLKEIILLQLELDNLRLKLINQLLISKVN